MKTQIFQSPKNETPEHFLLKNVALAYLRTNLNCNIASTEVSSMYDHHNNTSGGEIKSHRCIADAVGIKIKDQWLPLAKRLDPNEFYKRIETVCCIEVKISKADFMSGYCVGGDLNYIMAPVGVINKDDLYKGVGLLEVDFSELSFIGWQIHGVNVSKKPSRFKRDIDRSLQVYRIYQSIATQLTLNSIRNNPWFYPGYQSESSAREG